MYTAEHASRDSELPLDQFSTSSRTPPTCEHWWTAATVPPLNEPSVYFRISMTDPVLRIS